MNNTCLINKKCIPCHGGIPPINQNEAGKLLTELKNGWQINDKGHLYKQYKFDDFMGAMVFANKIAALAESEGHHPDLTISYGHCGVEIWTHKINGLAESDFILASKIEVIK